MYFDSLIFFPFWCQGVKAVIAKSFERIHRSNLVGMGIIPLCFKPAEDAETLGLTGHERYSIDLPSSVSEIRPGQDVTVVTDAGKSFTCTLRFDTEVSRSSSLLPLITIMSMLYQFTYPKNQNLSRLTRYSETVVLYSLPSAGISLHGRGLVSNPGKTLASQEV